jgi:hypothetical protein
MAPLPANPRSMITFAHQLDRIIHHFWPALFGILIIAWLFAAVSTARRNGKYPPPPKGRHSPAVRTAIAMFVGLIVAMFAVGSLINWAARREIWERMPPKIDSVTVNGAPFAKAGQLVTDLRGMGSTLKHHSEPTTPYRVTIRSTAGSLALVLARDSANPQEYWVFYGGFESTKLNDVGHVFTAALDPPAGRP